MKRMSVESCLVYQLMILSALALVLVVLCVVFHAF
jgi:hypothetical protein